MTTPLWTPSPEVVAHANMRRFLEHVQRECDPDVRSDAAHRAGARKVALHATVCAAPSDIVVVSNFGYPLDRDLYQAVKGLSVGSDAAKSGGTIILVAECRDGVGHREFFKLASMSQGPREILRAIRERAVPARDAWQAQILARILTSQHVIVVSPHLDPHDVRLMHMEWAQDIPLALAKARIRHGGNASIAVIPEGPATIVDCMPMAIST